MGGRWLFVSHEPLEIPEVDVQNHTENDEEAGELTKLFGLTRPPTHKSANESARRSGTTRNARFVRFAFEPMTAQLTHYFILTKQILHIATASLSHASPILSAAISAGFRESGVQSLKNLTDPNAIPMVAVRSAGLAFESIIGVVRERSSSPPSNCLRGHENGHGQEEEIVETLVGEEHLRMLVGIANERVEANTERIRRFEEALFGGGGKKVVNGWEDKETRQERKRAEGLRRREELKANHGVRDVPDRERDDADVELGMFEDIT
ncbi:MAG: hypothetical protein Q9168_008354 [Polycauliona sp. 1 TL-2023]